MPGRAALAMGALLELDGPRRRSLITPLLRAISRRGTHGDSKDEGKSLVHPTAVVHPGAVIGKDVSIASFCTIGANVKIGNGCQLHPACHVAGNTELGENCTVSIGAVVGADIPGKTIIGSNNFIGHYSVIGIKCQDLKYKAGDECFLYIGDNNDIREYTSIHMSAKSSEQTVIGDHNLIMGSCHIAHDCKIGKNNIFANSTLLAGHVTVEVSQDVPKYMLVSGDRAELRGLNLEGLRRCGFSSEEVRGLKMAYQRIFMSKYANLDKMDEKLRKVEEELGHLLAVHSMLQSIHSSFQQNRRGICRFRNWILS